MITKRNNKDNSQIDSLAHALGELHPSSPSAHNGCVGHKLLVHNSRELARDAIPPLLLWRHPHLLWNIQIGGHSRK